MTDNEAALDERPRLPNIRAFPDPYVRMAQECPRERGYEPHERGDYYHVRNRSGVCCVMGFVPRQDLSKLIGRWEI